MIEMHEPLHPHQPIKTYRQERVERLFNELLYEITRGMMEGDLDESIGFDFIVPSSRTFPHGVVTCKFRTRPIPEYDAVLLDQNKSRLRIIK